MDIDGVARYITPHLATSMPELAKATPFLLGFDVLIVAVTVLAVMRMTGRTAGHDGNHFRKRTPDKLSNLRDAIARLKRARIIIVIASAVVGVAWLALWITSHSEPSLMELLFVVVGVGVLVPSYIVVTLLASAFEAVTRVAD